MSRKRFTPIPTAQDDEDALPPSKSQVKRDMEARQALGERLVKLPKDRVKQLPLPERLTEAILEAQRITAHEGKRRQLQYVGKLMRDVNVEPIQQMLAAWEGDSAEQIAAFHQLERWRDRLLDNDEHLTAFINHYPAADVQHLRALVRAARKEQQNNEQLLPGQDPQRKQFRALFQEIKRLQFEVQFPDAAPAPGGTQE